MWNNYLPACFLGPIRARNSELNLKTSAFSYVSVGIRPSFFQAPHFLSRLAEQKERNCPDDKNIT